MSRRHRWPSSPLRRRHSLESANSVVLGGRGPVLRVLLPLGRPARQSNRLTSLAEAPGRGGVHRGVEAQGGYAPPAHTPPRWGGSLGTQARRCFRLEERHQLTAVSGRRRECGAMVFRRRRSSARCRFGNGYRIDLAETPSESVRVVIDDVTLLGPAYREHTTSLGFGGGAISGLREVS